MSYADEGMIAAGSEIWLREQRQALAAIVEQIVFDAVLEASGGPVDYVERARAGNWPIWRAAQLAAIRASGRGKD